MVWGLVSLPVALGIRYTSAVDNRGEATRGQCYYRRRILHSSLVRWRKKINEQAEEQHGLSANDGIHGPADD